jgi:hypothetical protein
MVASYSDSMENKFEEYFDGLIEELDDSLVILFKIDIFNVIILKDLEEDDEMLLLT